MREVNVLVIQPIADEELAYIARLDSRLRVVDARGWFDEEIRQTWPQWSVERYLGKRSCPPSTRQDRDHLLAQAEVILGGWPFPLDLRARSPRLRWFHQRPPAPAICCAAISGAATSSSPHRAARATPEPWPSMSWPVFSTLPAGCIGPTATDSVSASSTAAIDRS